MKICRFRFLNVLVCIGIIAASSMVLHAQQMAVSLSLAVPDSLLGLFTPQIINQFQTAHPNVQVDVIPLRLNFPDPAADLNQYLQSVRDLAGTADVVVVTSDHLTPQATRAHAVLDLKPYTDLDTKLNPDDFYPALWQSFQWDGGVWALPLSGQLGVLSYDPAAFDQAGIPYPTDGWTLDQLTEAVRKLAQKDASGQIQPGLDTTTHYFQATLFRSLLTAGLFDANTIPNPPQFDRPDVEALLNTWAALSADGLVSVGTQDAPLGIINPYALTLEANQNLKATLLPGSHAALVTTGLAVSFGTQYPDQAYTLANFLATVPSLARSGVDVPARKNLNNGSGGDAALQSMVNKALDHALPGSEVRYAEYLPPAVSRVINEHLAAKAVLQDTELAVANALQLAADPKSMMGVYVPTTIPDISGATLNIGLSRGIYNTDLWTTLAQEFGSHDAEIKRVILNYIPSPKALDADCFIGQAFSDEPPDSAYIDLAPLMTADSTLDPTDFIGSSLAQVTYKNQIWAYPLTIDLGLIKYDPALFKQAGVPLPTNDWSINTFLETLHGLKAGLPGVLPLEPSDVYIYPEHYDNPFIGLMAAYGGIPFNFSTDPVTLNTTDAAVIDAAQQTLDLVKNGYIKYRSPPGELSTPYTNGTDHPPMLSVDLTTFTKHPILISPTGHDPYQYVLYPQATDHKVVVYGLTVAKIRKDTTRAQACYRWIRFMAGHPELFQAMPASRAQLDNPDVAALQGSSLVALYKYVDELLRAPDTVSVPTFIPNQAGWLVNFWLGEAFDKYVLNGEDLRQSLAEATSTEQSFITKCYKQITPNLSLSPYQRDRAYSTALGACAQSIDPLLRKFQF